MKTAYAASLLPKKAQEHLAYEAFLRKVAYYLWSVVLLLVCVKNWNTLFFDFPG